ncbi:MAG: DUF1294 domain-containing protein [Actinomycetota bacterium]|nr:DUF1294 domain-containing protein [Actinomycetota bacterium]MDZ4179062.1 DUF1294 domain-containing protein [Coriobacteriia bacterium]
MRAQGRLTDWNDDRGFGFITPLSGGATVFAHVSQFPRIQRRPIITDLVTYDVETDDRGRLRARDIQFLAPTRARVAKQGHTVGSGPVQPHVVAALLLFALLSVGGGVVAQTWGLLATNVVLSLIAFAAYGLDKQAAQSSARRTPESTLHAMAFFGGWPGALVAQQVFRHKTQKQPFQAIFWLTVAGNVAIAVLLIAAFSSVAPG